MNLLIDKFVNIAMVKDLSNSNINMKKPMLIKAFWSTKPMNRLKISCFMCLLSILCIYCFLLEIV